MIQEPMTQDKPAAEQRLTFDYELDAPPEKVWRALTVQAFVDRWLRPEAAMQHNAKNAAAEVIEAEPPRRLSWNWREPGEPEGVVTFTLTPNAEGGTSLRLVHERRTGPAMRPAANSNAVMMMLAA